MAAPGSSANSLGIHIVEDHNEVLEHIYADIGKKTLPFTGTCLVHFDSHPDLLAPQEMPADRVYHKEDLFESLSIGDWILPAIYAGHFTSIVWIKPPWSNQIPTGHFMLSVGKHRQYGYLRVNLPIAYYLSEGLYACLDQLENVKTVPLYVLTFDLKQHIDTVSEPCLIIQKLLNESSAWILDIDLDFFSTLNPFKSMFTEEQYEYLSQLYGFQLSKANEDDPFEVNESRLCKLSSLLDLWSGKSADKNLIETQIKSLIGQERNGDIVEADDIHVAGMMTDLPHHVSEQSEIVSLIRKMELLLTRLKESSVPRLVTIARSSNDPYTPQDQVDKIQTAVIDTLSSIWTVKILTYSHYT